MCKLLAANWKLRLRQRVVTCACCRAPRDRDQERTKLLSVAHVRANVTSGPLSVVCVRPQLPPPLAHAASEGRVPSSTVAAAWGGFVLLYCGVIYSERSDLNVDPMTSST